MSLKVTHVLATSYQAPFKCVFHEFDISDLWHEVINVARQQDSAGPCCWRFWMGIVYLWGIRNTTFSHSRGGGGGLSSFQIKNKHLSFSQELENLKYSHARNQFLCLHILQRCRAAVWRRRRCAGVFKMKGGKKKNPLHNAAHLWQISNPLFSALSRSQMWEQQQQKAFLSKYKWFMCTVGTSHLWACTWRQHDL